MRKKSVEKRWLSPMYNQRKLLYFGIAQARLPNQCPGCGLGCRGGAGDRRRLFPAEGGTREGRVRGMLARSALSASSRRLAPIPPYCALFSALYSPSTTPSSPAALPFPYLGSGALAFYFYAYGYAYVPREHRGVFGPRLPASPAYVR